MREDARPRSYAAYLIVDVEVRTDRWCRIGHFSRFSDCSPSDGRYSHRCRWRPRTWNARGRSWLYGLEAYRRIFPDVFLAGLEPREPDLQFLACWGQLLDGAWRTRSDTASVLLHAVELASTTDDLLAAFPHAMQQSKIPFRTLMAQVAPED